MCASAARRALLVLTCTLATTALPAQEPDFRAERALPIELEAASSAFDRRNNRIVFEDVHIRQGTLTVTADGARVERIDFENNRWHFEGSVVIENQGARVFCKEAELYFRDHQLRSALLQGEPARFEQERRDNERTEGRAGMIDYEVTAGVIRLSGGAWLSDGANEVSGDRITYDLRREYVTANSEDGGQVRMKIRPPEREGGVQ
jgi:lipopolysaccharide export system protein LptA